MKSYPYQKLLIGIDCIGLKLKFKLNLKRIAKKLNRRLKQNGLRCIYIENQIIILNKFNASIGRIYQNINSESTFITLYGQSQPLYYKYNYRIPTEYNIILEYFIQQDLLIKLVNLDLALDFHYDYTLSLITNAKNNSIPKRNLNYLTNFITHEIHIPRINNEALIKKIKNDKTLDFLELDQQAKKGSRESYKKWTQINNYTNFKRVDETEADYLTLSIKDKNVFWKYFDLLKKYNQNIVFSKFDAKPNDVIIIKNSQQTSIIFYNKKERESENDFNNLIGYLKYIEEQHYPDLDGRLYHYNRVEIRKKFNLEIHNTQNFMDIIKTAFLKQIKKTHITIFKDPYQIRLYNENKKIKRKKDKHKVKSRNLTIDNIQFNLVMDDLEQALKVPFVANSTNILKPTKTTKSKAPCSDAAQISPSNKKMKKKAKLQEELKEERNNQKANNLLPENLTTDIKTG